MKAYGNVSHMLAKKGKWYDASLRPEGEQLEIVISAGYTHKNIKWKVNQEK